MTGGAHSRTTPGNRMDINQGMVEMTADIPVLVDPSLPTVSKNCQSHVSQSIAIGRHIGWHVVRGYDDRHGTWVILLEVEKLVQINRTQELRPRRGVGMNDAE